MYREQQYVEHCFCRAAAIGPCGCCGRARCAEHLERGLCNRCHQAVTREVAKSANPAMILGGTVFGVVSLGLLVAGVTASVLVGLPLGIGVGVGYRHWFRRRRIRMLGPVLAASKGELPAPPRDGPQHPNSERGPYIW